MPRCKKIFSRSLNDFARLIRAVDMRTLRFPWTSTNALSRLNFGVPVATVSRTRKRRNRTEVGSARRFRSAPPSLARPANPSLLLQNLVWTEL